MTKIFWVIKDTQIKKYWSKNIKWDSLTEAKEYKSKTDAKKYIDQNDKNEIPVKIKATFEEVK